MVDTGSQNILRADVEGGKRGGGGERGLLAPQGLGDRASTTCGEGTAIDFRRKKSKQGAGFGKREGGKERRGLRGYGKRRPASGPVYLRVASVAGHPDIVGPREVEGEGR